MDVADVNVSPTESEPASDRRRFLGWVSAAGAAAIGTLVGVPAVRALVSPALQAAAASDWLKVVDDVSTLDVGVPVKVDFVEPLNDAWVEARALRTVWVYTEDGRTFTAYSGVCTHLGCSFFYDTTRKTYHCPCHHGLFDAKTGAVVGGPPPRPLDTLPVRVVNGELHVQYQTFRPGIPEKVRA